MTSKEIWHKQTLLNLKRTLKFSLTVATGFYLSDIFVGKLLRWYWKARQSIYVKISGIDVQIGILCYWWMTIMLFFFLLLFVTELVWHFNLIRFHYFPLCYFYLYTIIFSLKNRCQNQPTNWKRPQSKVSIPLWTCTDPLPHSQELWRSCALQLNYLYLSFHHKYF